MGEWTDGQDGCMQGYCWAKWWRSLGQRTAADSVTRSLFYTANGTKESISNATINIITVELICTV